MHETADLPTYPFTWAQAQRLGISREQLTGLVAERRVRRVLRNVYQRYDAADDVMNRVLAAALVVTPLGVFCDRTAAWLYGVDVLDYRELEILPPVEFVVLRDRRRVERPECRGGERDLAPYDIDTVDGVRVTTPLRTALDLGCKLPRPDGLAALDQFMRIRGITHAELDGSLPRYRRRRGVVKLRGLVPLANGRSESPGESRTRLAIHDAGLPFPELQHEVTHLGVLLFRLDLAYPKSRVAVEYDGEEWHHRTQEQRDADRARREWLRRHGWTVIVVRRGMLSFEGRVVWLAELRQVLGIS